MDAVQNKDAVLQHAEFGGQCFTKLNLNLYWLVLDICDTLILH